MFSIILFALLTRTNGKTTDPYIRCFGQWPLSAALFPDGFSPAMYRDSFDLCSGLSGLKDGATSQNVGCFCSTNGGYLHCPRETSNTSLWDHQFPSGSDYTGFVEYCQTVCLCDDQSYQSPEFLETLEAAQAAPAPVSVLRNASDIDAADLAMAGSSSEDEFEGWASSGDSSDGEEAPGIVPIGTGSISERVNNTSQANNTPSAYDGFDDPNVRDVCGVSCTTNSECNNNPHCTCHVQSSQFIPGVIKVLFEVGCGLRLRRKRDEWQPCACNTTYVSHGCCDADDGMIWEPEQFKLGEVATEENMKDLR